MRTKPEDLAADLAEVDQRYARQQQLVQRLQLDLAIAKQVLDDLYRLKAGLEGVADLHRKLPTLEQDAADLVRRNAEMPF